MLMYKKVRVRLCVPDGVPGKHGTCARIPPAANATLLQGVIPSYLPWSGADNAGSYYC